MKFGNLYGFTEVMCTRRKVILLEADRDKWHRRVDLTHAIAHIDLGHVDRHDMKAEEAAVRYAAKLCLDLHPLGEALAESRGRVDASVAYDLGVDLETLQVRLRHLHPVERSYLLKRTHPLYADHSA